MQLPYLVDWSPRQRRHKLAWWLLAPRWLPQVEGWDVDSRKFPLHEDCKVYRIQEDSKDQQEGGETNNFASNEYREVVNLSGLVVYNGSKHKGRNNNAAERKRKQ